MVHVTNAVRKQRNAVHETWEQFYTTVFLTYENEKSVDRRLQGLRARGEKDEDEEHVEDDGRQLESHEEHARHCNQWLEKLKETTRSLLKPRRYD